MAVSSSDYHIRTAGGMIFARGWQPEDIGGNCPHILLFHDSLGSVALWRDFPEALAATCHLPVIAYDRLGFGRSDPAASLPGPDFMAEEARTAIPALSEAMSLDRLIPFRHSVGGAMAVLTAAAMPDRCAAVVTEAAQAFVEDRTTAAIHVAKRQFLDPDQRTRLARYHGEKVSWVLDAWFTTWLASDFADWSLDAALARVECPVLAIHGDRDEYGSIAHPERIVDAARGGAERLILRDCGHVPHREQQPAVLDAVARFLGSFEQDISGR